MKIRNGWVSNSSSSSFVIFASREAFDAALEGLTDIEKKIANLFISKKSEDFLGRKVYSYSYCSGNNGDYYYDQVRDVICNVALNENEDEDELNDKYMDFAFGGFESLVTKKAKEMGEGVLTDSQDW